MSKQTFFARAKSVFRSIATANNKVHELAIESMAHYGEHNGDTSQIKTLMELAFQNQDTFRYQALKAWMIEFAHVKISEPSEKSTDYVVKKDGPFTVEDLNKAKATPFFKWAPADKPLNAPKIPEASVITQLARGLATGEISEDEIKQFADTLLGRAKAQTHDSKVLDWVKKYNEQQAA